MIRIGLFYSFNSTKTRMIVEKIKNNLTEFEIHDVNIEDAKDGCFDPFENLIFGSSTWFDGELPSYWDEFLPMVEESNLTGKKLAVFGLGDHKNYSENFCDAIGILADFFEKRGAVIVGKFSIEGYNFEKSKALENNLFLGLPLDEENLPEIIDQSIERWTNQLKSEFI